MRSGWVRNTPRWRWTWSGARERTNSAEVDGGISKTASPPGGLLSDLFYNLISKEIKKTFSSTWLEMGPQRFPCGVILDWTWTAVFPAARVPSINEARRESRSVEKYVLGPEPVVNSITTAWESSTQRTKENIVDKGKSDFICGYREIISDKYGLDNESLPHSSPDPFRGGRFRWDRGEGGDVYRFVGGIQTTRLNGRRLKKCPSDWRAGLGGGRWTLYRLGYGRGSGSSFRGVWRSGRRWMSFGRCAAVEVTISFGQENY